MTMDRLVYITKKCLGSALLLFGAIDCFAASAPGSVSQLALYQGADREKILVEGAKKEAALTLYGSHIWYRTMAKEFEKKYPFKWGRLLPSGNQPKKNTDGLSGVVGTGCERSCAE
jgi:hypothetical protein